MSDINELSPKTLKEIVEGLKIQESIQRTKTSESLGKLKEWVEEYQTTDPYVTQMDKKNNPYNEKGKCIIA